MSRYDVRKPPKQWDFSLGFLHFVRLNFRNPRSRGGGAPALLYGLLFHVVVLYVFICHAFSSVCFSVNFVSLF